MIQNHFLNLDQATRWVSFIFFLYEAKLIEKKFYLLQKFCLIPLMQYFGDGKENDKSEAQESLIVPTVNREFW